MCSMVIGQSSKIIGTPIKIGGLEVAQNSFPSEMDWDEAKKACANLGSGWRLPTKEELIFLCENRAEIGGFFIDYYWSSSEVKDNSRIVWVQSFYHTGRDYFLHSRECYVRAVR